MNHARAADISSLDPDRTDWGILRAHRPNVLLEGSIAATEAALVLLQPNIHSRTLILRDAAALSRSDQLQLLQWIDDAGSHTQVVSTTERSLFALVADGLFDASLYYRLNIVLVRVGTSLIGSGGLDG